MPLHAELHGSGPRVVLVHGFTQTRRCWGSLVPDLAADHLVVAVDAPGHGRSADVQADLPTGADLLVESCGAGAGAWIGYSMGARLCLHLALRHPEAVGGLVLVGGTPGIEDVAERAARRDQDRALAARLREIGVERFVDEWLAQPLFAGLPADRSCREQRLENTVDGLASSLELAGTGAQEPLWERLGELHVPVLVVAGDQDTKFAAIGQRMAAAIGDAAELALVPEAGHTAHLEQPERFRTLLVPWLRRHAL